MKRQSTTAFEVSMLVIRNIVVRGKRTSVRLEPEMWEALQEIVQMQGLTINQLVTQLNRRRSDSSLTSTIRVYIVEFYRSRPVTPSTVEPNTSLASVSKRWK